MGLDLSAALCRVPGARMIDEHLPHDARSHAQQMQLPVVFPWSVFRQA
jgi:hypothetical protein